MPVYIAQTPGGAMKIGYSAEPRARVAALRLNAERAELLWYASFSSKEEELHFERFLLGEFEDTSIGGEWFASGDPAILDRIGVCRQKMDAARCGKHSLRLLKLPSVQVLHELACFDALMDRTSGAGPEVCQKPCCDGFSWASWANGHTTSAEDEANHG